MKYYIYENWQAKAPNRTLKIHKGSCGHCKDGRGKIVNAIQGRNGQWIGPFDLLESARSYDQNRTITECGCCKK